MLLPPAATAFMRRHDLRLPVIQAPMAGVSSPQLAAAVSNSGAIGSLGLGASSIDEARRIIRETRARTNRAFNANFFCHSRKALTPKQCQRLNSAIKGAFLRFGAEPPHELHEIYKPFAANDQLLQMVIEEKPAIVSFHFGLPSQAAIRALHDRGIYLIAGITCLQEAQAAQKAGIDAIVAQGFEAGGHRGIFDENSKDSQLALPALLCQLGKHVDIPVIAAGAIMNGASIRAALELGAAAAQMGTAFIGCPESLADAAYREKLKSEAAFHTVMTRIISGRPARALKSHFTELAQTISDKDVAPYPFAYDMAKQLDRLARTRNDTEYGAYWAGAGAPLARFMPAAQLIKILTAELGAGSAD